MIENHTDDNERVSDDIAPDSKIVCLDLAQLAEGCGKPEDDRPGDPTRGMARMGVEARPNAAVLRPAKPDIGG
jgi:hypothetical protein